MNLSLVLAVYCGAFCYILCNPVEPCSHTDEKCLEKISSNLYSKVSYSKVISGNPDLGIESLDPMHHDVIDGKLSILKFSLNNSDTKGFKDCKTENWKLSAGLASLHVDIVCPTLEISGKYEIHGRLIILPVEGNGDFYIISSKYRISLDADLKITLGKDGKNYISVKNFNQTAEPLGSVKFDFKNLFNGQKDLADAVLKFANENWYEVAKEVQEPIFTAHCKKMIKNVNKYLKMLPIEDLET